MSDRSLTHEAELMRRIVQRDQAALEDIVKQYTPLVQRVAIRVLNNDEQAAEEVVQDVFFQIWRWPEKWDPDKGTFMSWLLTVTRHTAIDHQRRLKHLHTLSPDTLEDTTPDTLHHDKHGDEHAMLKGLLLKLPLEQRRIVVLAFLRGMTHEEIAVHLNIPLGTVKSRLRLGMQKLRDAWLTQRDAKP